MRATAPRFGRVVTAMVTPFREDGSLDADGAATLARWLVEHGNDGLVLAGTTGESPTLTVEEQLELFRVVRNAVDVPLVGGIGGNDTAHTARLAEQASATGLDGLLAVTPYYNRPSQAGLEAHFRAVASATDLPIMVYDIPVRTGRKISSEVLVRLALEVDNVVALKDAAGSPAETARVIADGPDDFSVYSGDDGLTLPLLAVGAIGVVGVATHWCGARMGEMITAFTDGDHDGARRLNTTMIDSFAYETSERAPNPIPAKAMLRVLGLPAGQARLPMGHAPPGLEDDARRVLDGIGAP
jgi:4-hydroxy-tetrahydrodipicolinate synthase